MNVLVACFSASGKIGGIAEALANKLDAQYVNIEPSIGFLKGIDSMRSYFKLKAGIKPCQTDLSDVDHLVIVSTAATASASSYIMKYASSLTNCEGKKFSTVTRESNSNRSDPYNPIYTVGSAPEQIRKELEKKGMILFEEKILGGPIDTPKAARIVIDRFSEKILSSSP
ncbi:MAG: hypothetical protein HVN34_01655 [Methanobacteriaceae archaeon]|jgi:hypothetical protein|nr:hypothetical protein [Methanobacteriaceae archaeon]